MSYLKKAIGFSLGYNTSAALVDADNGVELAISEERLINEKNTKMFPIKAIQKCIDKLYESYFGGPTAFVFGVSHYEIITMRCLKYIPFNDLKMIAEHMGVQTSIINQDNIYELIESVFDSFYDVMEIYIRLKCDIPADRKIIFKRVDHHTAHMFPAYHLSEFKDEDLPVISVVGDGFGDGVSMTVFDHKHNEYISKQPLKTSIGLVYQYVTGALGFKEHQHEGKITGLAAFGEPIYREMFEEFIIGFDFNTGNLVPNYLTHFMTKEASEQLPKVNEIPTNNAIIGFDDMVALRRAVYNLVDFLILKANAKREDVAASLQLFAENMTINVINLALEKAGYVRNGMTLMRNGILSPLPEYEGKFNLTLSGGLFANVKLNYYVKQFVKPKELYILPSMGDEGTAIGAAMDVLQSGIPYNKDLRIAQLQLMNTDKMLGISNTRLYLGDCERKSSIEKIDISKYEIITFTPKDENKVTDLIANALSKQKIVCVSRGAAEFGPRALCNHSILYDAGEKETNDSLNARLNRTEFMPFAPVSLDKFTDDLYYDVEGLDTPLRYMTISVPVKQEFVDNYKAAYHVDKTARPQILHRNDNPFIYSVMESYFRATGKKVLINTSFNLHNYPIVYSDKVAYESFEKADLDMLVLKDKIIVKRDLFKEIY